MKTIAFKDGQLHSVMEDSEKEDGTGSISVTIQPMGADVILPVSDEDFDAVIADRTKVKLSQDKKSVDMVK